MDNIMHFNATRRIADNAYESGSPIMNDQEYDAIFGDTSTHHELEIRNGQELPLWMGSLDKKRDEKALKTWLDKTCADKLVISAKLDGISALYNPEDNKLYTRGNGTIGNDISRFIKHLDLKHAMERANEVMKLMLEANSEHTWNNTPLKPYVRGELIMKNEVFNLKYSSEFKNSRNLVSGQFAKKLINKDIISDIHFVPYEIIIKGMQQQCPPSEQLIKSLLLPWVEMKRSEITIDTLTQLLDSWKDCSFALDGLVVTEDRMYTRNVSGNPKYSIAFKKEKSDQTAITSVISVTWNTSRWGYLKPVVNVEPVQLSGVTIRKCTGHNAKYISDNKIGPGAQIVCARSGDVIPFIVSVVQPSNNVTLPSSKWDGVNLRVEDNDCDIIEIKTLSKILLTLDVKHVNICTITKMYTNCKLTTFAKIINCTKEDLYPTFKNASADRIVTEMSKLKSKHVKVHVLVGAAGVLGFGLGVKRVEKLFEYLGNWDTIPTVNDVCKVGGFEKKTAEKVINCFPDMITFLKTCINAGLKIDNGSSSNSNSNSNSSSSSSSSSSSKSMKKICLSGFRNDDLEKKYNVLPRVTKECDVLVCKSFKKVTRKMENAKKLGINMVLFDEFQSSY